MTNSLSSPTFSNQKSHFPSHCSVHQKKKLVFTRGWRKPWEEWQCNSPRRHCWSGPRIFLHEIMTFPGSFILFYYLLSQWYIDEVRNEWSSVFWKSLFSNLYFSNINEKFLAVARLQLTSLPCSRSKRINGVWEQVAHPLYQG
jgi:lipopolysaccharide biosynthesis glycosyltransferase